MTSPPVGPRAVAVVLGAAAAVGVTGCGPTGPAASPTSAQSVSDSVPVIYVPFEAARLGDVADQRRLHAAVEDRAAACMRGRGYRYTPQTFRALAPERDRLADLARARKVGYAQPGGAPPEPEQVGDVAGLSGGEQAARRAALLGPPPRPGTNATTSDSAKVVIAEPDGGATIYDTKGCLGQARQAVYGDLATWYRADAAARGWSVRATTELMRDPQVVAGIGRWRGCMASRGLRYPEPGAAAPRLAEEAQREGADPEQARRREIQVATADSQCYLASGLSTMRTPVLKQIEQRLKPSARPALDRMEQLRRAALARVARQPVSAADAPGR